MPYQATYAAAKAFVLSFTRALAYETMGTGVRVSALAPGATATAMHAKAGAEYSRYVQLFPVMSAGGCRAHRLSQFQARQEDDRDRLVQPLERVRPALRARLRCSCPFMGWLFRVRDAEGNLQMPRAMAERAESRRSAARQPSRPPATAQPRRLTHAHKRFVNHSRPPFRDGFAKGKGYERHDDG